MAFTPAHLHVTVVGGANTDIVGHSRDPLVAHDSNPGFVSLSSGGVARNVAENLARLRVTTSLVTAFGSDGHGRELERACRALRIDTAASLVCGDLPGSVYLAILDEEGDMALALNDMRALDRLTPRVLQARRSVFDGADLVVTDTNPPVEALEWLAAETASPLLVDLVSTAKAPRAQALLDGKVAVKCNAIEAAALLGQPAPDDATGVASLAAGVCAAGAGAAYVSAGALGTAYASAEERGWVAAPHVEVANATGAGDAFTAGVAIGMLAGRSVAERAALGSLLAGIALASPLTVSEQVSPGVVLEMLKEWDE